MKEEVEHKIVMTYDELAKLLNVKEVEFTIDSKKLGLLKSTNEITFYVKK